MLSFHHIRHLNKHMVVRWHFIVFIENEISFDNLTESDRVKRKTDDNQPTMLTELLIALSLIITDNVI